MNYKRLNQKKCLNQIQFANSQPNFLKKITTKKNIFNVFPETIKRLKKTNFQRL